VKDEPVDILDRQGRKTGQVMMKSEAHAKSMWHPVAHLWIYNSKGEILLQKRAPNKIVWPNKWDVAVAGHITAGDDPKNTVVREAMEELSIKVNPGRVTLFDRSKFEDDMPGGWINRVLIYSYICEMELELDKLILEAEETSEVRWANYEELEKELQNPETENNFSPPAKIFFKAAIKEVHKRKTAKYPKVKEARK